MKKYRVLIMALIMVVIGGAPFYLGWLMPYMAAAWLHPSSVVLFVIMAAAVATFVDGKFESRQRYSEYDPSRGIKIHLDSTPLELWKNGRIVDLHITPDKLLWIRDRHLNGSEVTTRALGRGVSISLEAGMFFVTSEKHGYKVTWPIDQVWRVK